MALRLELQPSSAAQDGANWQLQRHESELVQWSLAALRMKITQYGQLASLPQGGAHSKTACMYRMQVVDLPRCILGT